MPSVNRTKSTQTLLLKWQRNLSAFVREFRFENQLDRSQFRELTGFTEMNVKSLESRTEVSSWVRAIFKLNNLSEVCHKETNQLFNRIVGTRSRIYSEDEAKNYTSLKSRLQRVLDNMNPEIYEQILTQIEDQTFLSDEKRQIFQMIMGLKDHQADAIIKIISAFDEDNRRNCK